MIEAGEVASTPQQQKSVEVTSIASTMEEFVPSLSLKAKDATKTELIEDSMMNLSVMKYMRDQLKDLYNYTNVTSLSQHPLSIFFTEYANILINTCCDE